MATHGQTVSKLPVSNLGPGTWTHGYLAGCKVHISETGDVAVEMEPHGLICNHSFLPNAELEVLEGEGWLNFCEKSREIVPGTRFRQDGCTTIRAAGRGLRLAGACPWLKDGPYGNVWRRVA